MGKNTPLQAIAMVAAAFAIAIVANGFAGTQRRLVLPGFYPDARQVPDRTPHPPARIGKIVPNPSTTTTTAAPAPVPAATLPAATATTTVPPVTTTTATPTPPRSPKPEATTTTAASPSVPDPLIHFQPHPDKAYIEISGDDAELLHAKGVLFLDARRTSVFEEGHIAGARSFSVWEADVDDKVNALFEERSDPASQNQPIVIYCSGGACEDSHMLSQKLWGIQFNNIYVYKDGFPDWQKRGGAVRKGGQS